LKAGRVYIGYKQILLAFGFLLISAHSFSQASSPYSRYGLGYVRSTDFSANAAMGGISAPYASFTHINFTNPASYASLLRTTIEAGFNVDGVGVQTKDSTYRAVNGNINHIAIAFVPKPDKFAVTIGLLPYTNINYNFIQDYTDSSIGTYRNAYAGKGSLYQLFAGAAYKIKSSISERNEFSIGFNASYIFGRVDYQKIITFPDSIDAYSTRNITSMNVSSFNYSVGLQYRTIIRAKRDNDERSAIYMTLGAYGSGGIKMNAKTSNYWERFDIDASTNTVSIIDTSLATYNVKSKLNMPYNLGLGAMFGNERFWLAGADFKYSAWSRFTSPLSNDVLKDNWRVAVGIQVTPKYDDRKYFNRVQYRFGGYYGKSQFAYKGSQLSEAGGTVGLGFPFKLSQSTSAALNVSADIGKRSAPNADAISESFYKITIGFVLNDRLWFIKRKFD